MSGKGVIFFEEHIEKIVLVVVGLVCLLLLVFRVLNSPNVVSYDNKKFGPGDIDNYILTKQAEELEEKLNGKPEPPKVYKRRFDGPIEPNDPVREGIRGNLQRGFVGLVDLAISDIDVSLYLPQPNPTSTVITVEGAYRIPLISEVNEVSVERIRAVAYVPTEKIDEENVYDEAVCEPNDIDFVTVEAKFDVAGLVKDFYESFAGDDVPEEERDPCLANPVFAAVQLQRQELLADGSWSDWQIVPRTRIDPHKKMFEVIEEVKGLPTGGIKVRLLQFDDAQVRANLLQPEAYEIASAEEEWFPPTLHKKFVKFQEDIKARERLEAREAEIEEREQEREEARSERRSRTTEPRVRGVREGVSAMPEAPLGSVPSRGSSPRGGYSDHRSVRERSVRERMREERESDRERPAGSRRVSETTSVRDIYDEFDKISITEKTDFSKVREPLMFWAHDDTIEPEKSYRYRIRLGVFNPIAGTNQFSEQDKGLKNKVILWSEFSKTTDTVEIPGTLYFFPTAIQEAARTVTVTVCRYVLGYWYSKDFAVKQGEVVGKVVESEPVGEEEEVTVPEEIDYATGVVLVDVIAVNDWSGGKNLRARYYFDMLYSVDGINIEHMPVKTRYWSKELQIKFNEIKKLEGEPKKPLRPWGGRRGEPRRGPKPGVPGFDEERFMREQQLFEGMY